MDERYFEYLTDPNGIIAIDGYVYYKIIYKDTLGLPASKHRPQKTITILVVDLKIGGGEGSIYVDEDGHQITCAGIEFDRYGSPIPEWRLNTISLGFYDIDEESLGSYLALYKE